MAGGCRPRRLDYAAIRELYLQEGHNGATVAAHFNCSRTVVYEVVHDIKKPYIREQDWSEAEIETLRNLWGTMTTRKIAGILGRGKNAIVGKAHRLELPKQANPITKVGEPKPYRMPRKAFVIPAQPSLPFTAPMQPAVNANTRVGSAVSLPVVDSEPARPLRFHELERKHCHWFIENPIRGRAHETMCCADPVLDGHAYCSRHHARAVDKRRTEASQDNLVFLNPWAKEARRAAE